MTNLPANVVGQKNNHMTHIEDKVIYGGVDGTREAILALRALRDMLRGEHRGNISVKWDGAPAIFAGEDPSDGRFFVAKKSIFNKNPKVYKTIDDIDADTSGDLADKLKAALKYLPELGIKGVIQGDFLFTADDLKFQTIYGQKYVTFHPNTIVYAIPFNSDSAKHVCRAKIGIVWHTTYVGHAFETMKASYSVDVTQFNKTHNVWSQDAKLRDLTNITLSHEDTEYVNQTLSRIGKLFNQISGTTLRQLEIHPDLPELIEMFNNKMVRRGKVVVDPAKHADDLIVWIENRFQEEINARKTVAGKTSVSQKLQNILEFFSQNNKQSLIRMFELQQLIVLAKLKLINTLNKMQEIDTFVKTSTGFRVTGAEGYVAIDKLGGDAVKIVDRLEFSHNNFSPNILKGWDIPGRR